MIYVAEFWRGAVRNLGAYNPRYISFVRSLPQYAQMPESDVDFVIFIAKCKAEFRAAHPNACTSSGAVTNHGLFTEFIARRVCRCMRCPTCRGAGKLLPKVFDIKRDVVCRRCGGTGLIKKRRRIRVRRRVRVKEE